MDGNMPWWQSKIIIGALVSMIGKALVISGVIGDLAPENIDALTNTIVLIMSGVGDLVAIGSRIKQKKAPEITLTKKE